MILLVDNYDSFSYTMYFLPPGSISLGLPYFSASMLRVEPTGNRRV